MKKFPRAALASRVREIRQEVFGDDGGPLLARRIELPSRVWSQFEAGRTIPAEVILRFMDLTNANPRWLWTGEGDKYLARHGAGRFPGSPVTEA
jgi:hypothetical protein